MRQVENVFRESPEKIVKNAEALTGSLQPRPSGAAQAAIDDRVLSELTSKLATAIDPVSGGLKGAPKFPQYSFFWLLWRGGIRYDDAGAREGVIVTLDNICQGGIYDHLGGGFARYSVDETWLVPHFEKMLYDNALLIELMTEVYRETQSPLYKTRIAETVAWLKREMIAEGGGFAASLDADSDGVEGKFYVWTLPEIVAVLGEEDAQFFAQVYDVTPHGNWEEVTILNRLSHLSLRSEADERRLAEMRSKLLAVRDKRVRPGWDDKVLADWNGLMIAALARASIIFAEPQWLELARGAFDFVATHMVVDGRLRHASRNGQVKAPATASDYANMIWAGAASARGDERGALFRICGGVDRGARPSLLDDRPGRICNLCRRHGRRDRTHALGHGRRDAQCQRGHALQSDGARGPHRRGALPRSGRRPVRRLRRRDRA